MPNHLVAPSLLAADFSKLESELNIVNESSADWLHFDTMDGSFVPNFSLGLNMLRTAKKMCSKPIDVHLMIEQPGRHIEAFCDAGADHITVHQEACTHLHRTIQKIKACGVKAGVAINPATNVNTLEDVLEDLDIILLMSVNPGFGGQKFIYRTIAKLEQLKATLTTRNLNPEVVVDGGVGLQNAQKILQAGATVLVAGSAVFKSNDPHQAIEDLKNVGHQVADWT